MKARVILREGLSYHLNGVAYLKDKPYIIEDEEVIDYLKHVKNFSVTFMAEDAPAEKKDERAARRVRTKSLSLSDD